MIGYNVMETGVFKTDGIEVGAVLGKDMKPIQFPISGVERYLLHSVGGGPVSRLMDDGSILYGKEREPVRMMVSAIDGFIITKEQAEAVEKFDEIALGLQNKLSFLYEIADQQYNNGHEISSEAWLGLSLMLIDISNGIGEREVALNPILRQLEVAA